MKRGNKILTELHLLLCHRNVDKTQFQDISVTKVTMNKFTKKQLMKSDIAEGFLLQTACFSSFHRCSIGFISGPIEGHFKIVQCFVLSHSWVFLAVFWAVILLEDYMSYD